jgi:hypothetical protein
MIPWISKTNALITSLVYWEKHYEPYQVIIFRWDHKDSMDLIYYFNLDGMVIAFPHMIEKYRTNKEEEKMYHIARLGLMLLEQSLENLDKGEDLSSYTPPENKELDSLLKDAFMSDLAIALIREEKHPTFGYYSLAHNYNKLEKMVLGQPYQLFERLLKLIK